MQRRELLDQALKETGSISKALNLVKEWESFASEPKQESEPQQLKLKFEPCPSRSAAIERFFEDSPGLRASAPMLPAPSTIPICEPIRRKAWKTDHITLAEAMMNAGHRIGEVAKILDRTESSVHNALRKKILNPKVDPRNPTYRARSLRGAITRGCELFNYEEAQTLLDK